MRATPSFRLIGSALALAALLAGCERPPVESQQRGYRGTGMVHVANPRGLEKQAGVNQPPAPAPDVPAGSPPAGSVYKNVPVLGSLGVGEFTRLMVAMTAWVSPEQGCNYCHEPTDLASDKLYTKVVARRMLQMTQSINEKWGSHVGGTGVTCYTCHRGQPIPTGIWFANAPAKGSNFAGNRMGQNTPLMTVGLTALPHDAFGQYLQGKTDIRVGGTTALPKKGAPGATIVHTEETYGLMMHMSQALGVNCTYCHNTRSFASWDGNPPTRAAAYHGIRMVGALNSNYLTPLAGTYPKDRLGPTGDAPKANCETCHKGAYKPLYGANLLKAHPELAKALPAYVPPAAVAVAEAAGVLPARVLFESGKKDIGAEGMKAIELALAEMKKDAVLKVDVSGFADKSGNPEKNLELAKQRAIAVRDALLARGVDKSRVNLKKPEFVVGGNDADARRVEIVGSK
jgi:photosynthetic reaction center cytochrome c subunit